VVDSPPSGAGEAGPDAFYDKNQTFYLKDENFRKCLGIHARCP